MRSERTENPAILPNSSIFKALRKRDYGKTDGVQFLICNAIVPLLISRRRKWRAEESAAHHLSLDAYPYIVYSFPRTGKFIFVFGGNVFRCQLRMVQIPAQRFDIKPGFFDLLQSKIKQIVVVRFELNKTARCSAVRYSASRLAQVSRRLACRSFGHGSLKLRKIPESSPGANRSPRSST